MLEQLEKAKGWLKAETIPVELMRVIKFQIYKDFTQD
jgi:hypothetical protein